MQYVPQGIISTEVTAAVPESREVCIQKPLYSLTFATFRIPLGYAKV